MVGLIFRRGRVDERGVPVESLDESCYRTFQRDEEAIRRPQPWPIEECYGHMLCIRQSFMIIQTDSGTQYQTPDSPTNDPNKPLSTIVTIAFTKHHLWNDSNLHPVRTASWKWPHRSAPQPATEYNCDNSILYASPWLGNDSKSEQRLENDLPNPYMDMKGRTVCIPYPLARVLWPTSCESSSMFGETFCLPDSVHVHYKTGHLSSQ